MGRRAATFRDGFRWRRKRTGRWLFGAKNGTALAVLHLLTGRLNRGTNAVIMSHEAIASALGITSRTARDSTKKLEAAKFVQVLKSGTSNVYVINSRVAWQGVRGMRHASFNADLVVVEQEQDRPVDELIEESRACSTCPSSTSTSVFSSVTRIFRRPTSKRWSCHDRTGHALPVPALRLAGHAARATPATRRQKRRSTCARAARCRPVQRLGQKGLDALRAEHALLLKGSYQKDASADERAERRAQIERLSRSSASRSKHVIAVFKKRCERHYASSDAKPKIKHWRGFGPVFDSDDVVMEDRR